MAEINFGILDTQAPGRIAALPQQLQEQQAQNAMRLMQFKNTVQQNALAQAKIDEYKRDLAEKDVLRKFMTQPGFNIYDPKYQAEAMSVAPTLAAPIIKHAVEVKQAQARTEKDIAQTGTATTETAVKRQTFLNQAKRDLAGNPSDDNIRAWAQDAVIQKVFSPEQAEQIQANLLKVPLDQRQAMFASAGAPARQPSSMERLIAARDSLPVGSPDRLAIEAQINKEIAGNRTFDPNTGSLIDKVTGQPVASGAAPAGQPGTAPLAPGIAPVQTPQAQTGGFPRVTPQVQAARDTDRLAILERELASQQAAGRVDLALQAEIANARRQAGVPANALAGAPTSVNALAGAPTGAATPRNPAEAKIAFAQQQQALYEPVQVIDPDSGKPIYVSKAEAITKKLTPVGEGSNTVKNVIIDETGRVTLINRSGEVIKPTAGGEPANLRGKPSATYEKTRQLREQLDKDLTTAIAELKDITKDGGLIDQSTGSGAGRAVDLAAGFVGGATSGAIAAAKLAPIADLALKMVPRFEGPQSDKDTQSYKQAAGQLADPSLPNKIRKEAGKTVLRLMQNRKNQFVTQGMAAEGIGAATSSIRDQADAILRGGK